jgi:aminopeptidase YwaD
MLAAARQYLQTLCVDIESRRVGSEGNRRATDFVGEKLRSLGFTVETPEFDCIDWREEGVNLVAGAEHFTAKPSPYAPGCRTEAELVAVKSVEELEALDGTGKIVLLHGEIAREQLMPKSFVFYNPEHQQKIVRLLESKGLAAIITATGHNPDLAGGLYPFPLIEDGDFDVPSVYMTDIEGERLVPHAGNRVVLHSRAERIPSKGCNVLGRTGKAGAPRLVFCAHVDAKIGTPGATDDAGGIVVLLLLAELLCDYTGTLPIEIVAFNGEDYYANSGEMQYLQRIQADPESIMLAVNIDGAGYVKGNTAWSIYEADARLEEKVARAFSPYDGIERGEPWYQGDHSLFTFNARPAVALTTGALSELMTHTHTPRDNPSIVDHVKLVELTKGLRDLVDILDS